MLEGKAALVTRGGSGLGRASAIALARAGASVTVADVDEQGGKQTADLASDEGADADFVRADVTQVSDKLCPDLDLLKAGITREKVQLIGFTVSGVEFAQ